RENSDEGITLRYHYRCKPSIIAYCNELSYSGTLQPRTKEADPFPEPALAWVAVDKEPTPVGGSFRNNSEADELISWIVERWPRWQEDSLLGGKPVQEIVAVITAYRPQADYLQDKL